MISTKKFFKINERISKIFSHVPKISVIIPVYNVEKYLSECLDSILNQTFNDIEVICVNDGSTDNSLSILKEYQNKDSRIKILTQKNKGAASARNNGLNQAKGKYIYFMDSDDYIENNAFAEIYNLSESKNLDMNIFKIISFMEGSEEKFTSTYLEMEFLKDLVGDEVFSFRDLGKKMYDLAVTPPGVLFKRDLISDIRFPEGLIYEDNVFFLEAVFNAKRMYFYDKHLYNYRRRNESVTTTGSNFSDIIEIRNMIIDLARKYDNFYPYLYYKKLNLIRNRFLDVSEEYKEDFFRKIQKDFNEHKEEYESSKDFNKLSDNQKKIFYAGLNASDYKEFENMVTEKSRKK